MFFSPLDQFLVISVYDINNMYLYILVALYLLIFFYMLISSIHNFMVERGLMVSKSMILSLFNFILTSAGLDNIFLFPVWTLCISLLSFNIMGLLPLGFTVTTHLIVSLSFSVLLFVWLNSIFFLRFFVEWGALFLPSGTPIAILFLIVPIEALSYISRILSLSIRLFANMLSGHTLLVILSVFLISGFSGNIMIILPLILLHLIFGLEIGVAMLQAYVFTTLILLYLNDTISFDH